MSFLFRRKKRGSKSRHNRNIPQAQVDDRYREPIRDRSSTADYPRSHPHHVNRNRSSSGKVANKSLVTKMNEDQTNSIPGVNSPHEGNIFIPEVANDKSLTRPETRDKELEITRREINLTNDVTAQKRKVFNFELKHSITKVEEKYETPTSEINYPDSKLNGIATAVEDVKVQVHRPANEVSLNNESASTHVTDKMESNSVEPKDKTKRKTSITISEKDALGLLDDVIRVFDDFDDNLDDASRTESKKPDISDSDPRYESMADIKQTLDQDDMKHNGVQDSGNSTYHTTTSTSHEKQVKNELVPPTQAESIYAKPVKLGKKNSSSVKPGEIIAPPPVQQITTEKAPEVPVKKFVVDDDHEIKFSPLRRTSPSSSLSKSLNNTTWANEVPSPKRRPMKDNNDNFSLKRGQLSGPVPIITDDDYVEPPPDYDLNTSLNSLGKPATNDTWGSVTSSSTSGSNNVRKEFRPEAKKLIKKKKAEKDDKNENDSRQYDGLVNRSFLMREASVKQETSKSTVNGDTASQSDIESDYTSIKNEAENWLQGYERLRASSNEATHESILKLKSNMKTRVSTENQNEQTRTPKVENDLPSASQGDTPSPLSETTQEVLNQPRASDDAQVASESVAIVVTESQVHQTKKGKKEKTNTKSRHNLAKDDEHDLSDDENLIKLMETGYTEEDLRESPAPEPQLHGYVPRAMRMSFGQSWEGIRKDRREWKSREMRQAAATQVSRMGGKNLSNRFDEQKVQSEMLF